SGAPTAPGLGGQRERPGRRARCADPRSLTAPRLLRLSPAVLTAGEGETRQSRSASRNAWESLALWFRLCAGVLGAVFWAGPAPLSAVCSLGRSRCCISPGARSWRGCALRPSRCHGRSPLCSSGRRSSRSTPGLLSSGIKWYLLFGRSTCFLEISCWSCSLETRLPSSHQLVEAEPALVLLGTTRNNFEGKKVIRLEYEAYTSMAETEIKKICRDVRQKWPSVKHIAVHHRLGVVPITEASVIIAASSPHRAESLEAVMYCINTLKASVPIWKKWIKRRTAGTVCYCILRTCQF
uniref:Molybdopterin synthase catalytic subunit n=1 Tax=Cyanistes caeruleus TaxID=156563 RepID=A0A8C0ZG16_CYACU